jgi:hypothetical protein
LDAREYYSSDPKEKFIKFREYIYHAKKEYRKDDTIKMGLFKGAVCRDSSPRKDKKAKEKDKPKSRETTKNKRGNEIDKKDQPKDEKSSRKRGCSEERHVSTEPEQKR